MIVADIRNPYFTALIRAVEEVAYRAGMRVTLCNTDEDPEREALYLQLMQEERITGLIFAPTRSTVGRMHELVLDYPTVLVDRAGPGSRYDSVVLDNAAAMGELVAHLQAQGYRRIGGLFGTSTTATERRNGYLAAMRAPGLTPAYREVAPTAEAAIAEVGQWLAGADRPEAIVTSNSLLLMGALKAARTAGLRLPDDLALAGFDNERWTDLVEPGITVVEQPVEDYGPRSDVAAAGTPGQPAAADPPHGDDRPLRGARLHRPPHPTVGAHPGATGVTGRAHRAQGRSYNGVAGVADRVVQVLPEHGMSPIPSP